jgi:nucleolar protein 56
MFAKITVQIGKRDQFTSEKLRTLLNLNENLATTVANNASSSMGAEITDFDLTAIQRFAQNIINIYDLRTQTEHYIDAMMSQVAPNVQTLVGSLVGARLLSLAGGLRTLALKPASTIQILGAEKALFRSLKSPTATSPKHGVIFQWPPLRTAKFWLRGKIARAVAGKLAIAAKADFFTGSYIGDELAADLRKRMADIEKKYPDAPKQEKKPPAPRRREGGFPGGGRKGKPFQKRGDRSFGHGPNRPRPRGPNRPRPSSKGGNN